MRVVVVFKDDTDYARSVQDFLRDFERQTGHQLDVVDPESADGAQFCEAYDIVRYPTILAISDDGQLQNQWSDLPLPTINEVSFYARQD